MRSRRVEDLVDDDIAPLSIPTTLSSLVFKVVASLVEVSLMMVFNRNRSLVFTSKCGTSAMSSSPRSSSSPRYHEFNKKEVSKINIDFSKPVKGLGVNRYFLFFPLVWVRSLHTLVVVLTASCSYITHMAVNLSLLTISLAEVYGTTYLYAHTKNILSIFKIFLLSLCCIVKLCTRRRALFFLSMLVLQPTFYFTMYLRFERFFCIPNFPHHLLLLLSVYRGMVRSPLQSGGPL